MTSAVMALFKFPKIVNKIPNAVINKYDAQYGILATVLRATQGVYIVIPMMKTFLAINVADANRRTKMLLNLKMKSTFFRNSWNTADFVCYIKHFVLPMLIYMDEVIFANRWDIFPKFYLNFFWLQLNLIYSKVFTSCQDTDKPKLFRDSSRLAQKWNTQWDKLKPNRISSPTFQLHGRTAHLGSLLKKRIAILIIINHLCICKFPYFCMRKIKFVYFFQTKRLLFALRWTKFMFTLSGWLHWI